MPARHLGSAGGIGVVRYLGRVEELRGAGATKQIPPEFLVSGMPELLRPALRRE